MKNLMGFFKDSKYKLLLSFAFIVFGVILTVLPTVTMGTICYVIGVLLAIKGAGKLISYYLAKKKEEEHLRDVFSGILYVIGATVLVLLTSEILSVVPTLIGIGVLIYGITSLIFGKARPSTIIISALTIILGASILILKYFFTALLISLSGVILIAIGVLIIIAEINIRKIKNIIKKAEECEEIDFEKPTKNNKKSSEAEKDFSEEAKEIDFRDVED